MSRDLYTKLEQEGLLEYGSFIPRTMVIDVLKLVVPEVGPAKVFREIDLQLLSATDYVRNILLNSGKYLTAAPDGYRILLPSENAGQVDLYMTSADKKLRRAIKLSKNTPKEATTGLCNAEVRARSKRDSIADHRRRGGLLE